MTFSEFAQVMSIYCRGTIIEEAPQTEEPKEAKERKDPKERKEWKDPKARTDAEFVIHLVNQIMAGRPGRMHANGTFQNPLGHKDAQVLASYYKGTRSITKGDASIILSSIDKYKFEEYLRKNCSENAQKLLMKDLSEIESIDNKGDFAEVCADLFEKILHDLATK